MLVNSIRDIGGQRPGVADTGGAAVADDVEAQLLKIWQQPGALVVVGDDAGAGRERGLDPWRDGKAALDGFFSQQACGDHHGRIAGVGAGGNGRDDDRAMVEVRVGIDAESLPDGAAVSRGVQAQHRRACADADQFSLKLSKRRARLDGSDRARRVAVGGSVAAFPFPTLPLPLAELACLQADKRRQLPGKVGCDVTQHDAILRAARAGNAWLHCFEVKFQH